MKKIIQIISFITGFLLVSSSCQTDYLDETVYSQLAPGNFLIKKEGIEGVLGSAYRWSMTLNGGNGPRMHCGIEEFPTDIHWQLGGGAHNTDVQFNQLSWDASTYNFGWDRYYYAIRDANLVIENIENVKDVSNSYKSIIEFEARFVRAYTYFQLYQLHGPVPLRISIEQPAEIPRATEEEMLSFLEEEFLACISGLPEPGQELQYGRGHKAAAMSYLLDLYMTTKRWQDAANVAQEIIDLNEYSLFPNYADMFKVENERNSEYIWIFVAKPDPGRNHNNEFVPVVFPNDFAKDPDSGLEWNSSWVTFANNYKLKDEFVNSFHQDDLRSVPIMKRYVNNRGDTIQSLGNNDSRSFKYWPDPNAIAQSHGNDIPKYRYADILLYRAEALNELNGPNQESLNLINQIRRRAGLQNDLVLSDFSNKDELRDHILKERGWEFFQEGKRRRDFIRMGKFVEQAHERGFTHVQAYRERYPIPQFAMDANPLLEQNEGY